MNKELEEAKVLLSNLKNTTNTQEYVNNFSIYDNAIETVLNYIDNSISKEVIEEKIEELNEGIKRDMINYDKVKDESWKMAIHRSITQKIETKKVLQQLLEGK